MQRVTFVFPTAWDLRQLTACESRWRDRFVVAFTSPSDEECLATFDVLDFVEAMARDTTRQIHGVTSSSDYPGAVIAAAIARARGLAGAPPEAVLRCANKYMARVALARAVPEAVPAFALVTPGPGEDPARLFHPHAHAALPLPAYPLFVKPVKGAFSVFSGRVENATELAAFVQRPAIESYTHDYLRIFHCMQERWAPESPSACSFLAEEVLQGIQTTVEGYVAGGQVELLGIVDSVLHPGTRCFARFEYPSSLPAGVQTRMADLAQRAIPALGLESTLFNIEMTWDPATDRLGIIEVNPRMCGQFADLYEKVDGTNGYEVALALAVGERPVLNHRAGSHRVAASVPLRVFTPTHVVRTPNSADRAAAEHLFPGTLVWVECEPGQDLADFESTEDGSSARYAILNVGATSRDQLTTRIEAIQVRLAFQFTPAEKLQSSH